MADKGKRIREQNAIRAKIAKQLGEREWGRISLESLIAYEPADEIERQIVTRRISDLKQAKKRAQMYKANDYSLSHSGTGIDPDYRFRAEYQGDVLKFCGLMTAFAVEANSHNNTDDKPEFVVGKNGIAINKELVEAGYSIEKLREVLSQKADAKPPRFHFMIYNLVRLDPPLPDMQLDFSTNIPFDQIRKLIKQIPDGHVMLETFAPFSEYSGERTYEEEE